MSFTIQNINNGNLLLECISGSRAYGLSTPKSDTDIRGVFVLPQPDFYSLQVTEQVQNDSNDIVYYELRRFTELLAKNNPNMLEMLCMPEDCIQFKHPLFDLFKPEIFLSKLCKTTFAGYALTQVKKARGLNKKIVNPVEPERKSVLDFCFVVQGQGSVPVQSFLNSAGIRQEDCGVTNIPHMPGLYGIFHQPGIMFRGIAHSDKANDIALSSIPKGLEPIAYMSFNKNSYSTYCKEYLQYWEWVEKRNDERYQNTLSHGKNYDAKNLMHTFRLLDMAEEIGRTGQIIVRRPNREFLLKIRAGEFEYEELLKQAEERIAAMDDIYETSDLPESPDLEVINKLLIKARLLFYKQA